MGKSANFARKIIAWLVILCFVAYIFYFFYRSPEQIFRLLDLSFNQIILLTLLTLFIFAGLGQQIKIMVKPYIADLSLYESFQLSLSNNLLNYLPLKTGVIAKGMYLKTVYYLRLQDYVLALTSGQLVWILISGIVGFTTSLVLIFLNFIVYKSVIFLAAILFFLAALTSFSILYYSDYLPGFVPVKKLRSFLQAYSDEIKNWMKHESVLKNYGLASILLLAFFTLRLWYSFQIVGHEISMLTAIFLQSCVAVGFAFSLVPGNLGLKEGLIVGMALLFGVDSETAVLAALIDRAASLLPTLILGPVFLQNLSARLLNQESAESP